MYNICNVQSIILLIVTTYSCHQPNNHQVKMKKFNPVVQSSIPVQYSSPVVQSSEWWRHPANMVSTPRA